METFTDYLYKGWIGGIRCRSLRSAFKTSVSEDFRIWLWKKIPNYTTWRNHKTPGHCLSLRCRRCSILMRRPFLTYLYTIFSIMVSFVILQCLQSQIQQVNSMSLLWCMRRYEWSISMRCSGECLSWRVTWEIQKYLVACTTVHTYALQCSERMTIRVPRYRSSLQRSFISTCLIIT